MGKDDGKSHGNLGRALVKHRNQQARLIKEKGQAFNTKRVLESVTDVSDIDAVIQQAEEAGRAFDVLNPVPTFINLDLKNEGRELTAEEMREEQKNEENLYRSILKVPRRPQWNVKMTPEELDDIERDAFLTWRRSLARLEENDKLVLTPFEKNLDIWRQLWRVIERSDLLVMVVDARDPLFYWCPDLEVYCKEMDEHKRVMLLVNKADLLPYAVRQLWAKYFKSHNILHIFWSAKAASAAIEGKRLDAHWKKHDLELEPELVEEDLKVYGREELLVRLQVEARTILDARTSSPITNDGVVLAEPHSPSPSITQSFRKGVMVGFVGYPNVGKSSTINALVGEKRTGVTSTPGKTKHFQTLIISDELTLCDCPGLVFPSFSSSRHDMVASGVLPIDRMINHRDAVQVVANRVPRIVLENIYNINLPKPKAHEVQSRPPLAAELLRAYCASRGYVASSGLPDETRAARQILKDYLDGKLPHFELPPDCSEITSNQGDDATLLSYFGDYAASEHAETSSRNKGMKEHEAVNDEAGPSNSKLEHMLNDLGDFDSSQGLVKMMAKQKREKVNASLSSHKKHHKKPQRTKDRSWRVMNDGGDGMPVVGVFQKPVSYGAITKI